MHKESNIPIIPLANNLFAYGGNIYSVNRNMGLLGMDLSLAGKAGQFVSGNQGAISAAGGLTNGIVDLVAPSGSIGGGAAKGAITGATSLAGLGPLGMAAGALVGGGLGAFNAKKNQDREDRTNEIASLDSYGASRGSVNPYANGVYAKGGDLPNLNVFGGGFKHDDPNPLNVNIGIPQGSSSENGQDNVVENNETRWKDFIFSDKLPVLNSKDHFLPKHFDGNTFAEASKLASKYIEDRPGDPIAQKTQEVF